MQMVRMHRMPLLLDPPRHLSLMDRQCRPDGRLLQNLLCQLRTRSVPEELKNLAEDLLLLLLLRDQCP